MEKTIQILIRCVCALIVIVISSYSIVAENTINGKSKANEYTNRNGKNKNKNKDKDKDKDNIEVEVEVEVEVENDWKEKNDPNKVHLNFRYETSKGGSSNHGSSF